MHIWLTLGISIWVLGGSILSYVSITSQNKEYDHLAAEKVRQSLVTEWTKIAAHHTILLDRVAKFKARWDTVFNMPVLLDKSYPTTMNLLNAERIVQEAAADLPNGIDGFDGTELSTSLAYVNAVHEFSVALEKAEEYARLIGQQGLPFAERQNLQTLHMLLKRVAETSHYSLRRTRYVNEAFDGALSLKVVKVPEPLLFALKQGDSMYQTFPGASVSNATAPGRLVKPPTARFLALAASSSQKATQAHLSESKPTSSTSVVAAPAAAPSISATNLTKNEFLPEWGTVDGKLLPKPIEETVTTKTEVLSAPERVVDPPAPERAVELREELPTLTVLQDRDVWAIPNPFSSSLD